MDWKIGKKTAPPPPKKNYIYIVLCLQSTAPRPHPRTSYFFIWNNSQLLCSGVQEYMYSLFLAKGFLVSVCMYVCMYVYVCPGRLAFVKMYNNFLQVVVLLKNAVLWISFVQKIFWKKKKNDEQTKSVFSREVKSRRIHCKIDPGKTRLKFRLFLPAILAGN